MTVWGMVQVGAGTLSVSYTGVLNDKMKGFYRSKYFGPTGDERFGAVTQFEVGSVYMALLNHCPV